MTSSATPQRLRMIAQMTPVRSLPAVQWMINGESGELRRWRKIVVYDFEACSRISVYASVNPYVCDQQDEMMRFTRRSAKLFRMESNLPATDWTISQDSKNLAHLRALSSIIPKPQSYTLRIIFPLLKHGRKTPFTACPLSLLAITSFLRSLNLW